MRFYLAARYSRRLELCGYKKELERMGHTVHARWLNGDHQIADDGAPIGEDGTRAVESGDQAGEDLRRKLLRDDLEDVLACTVFVAFTESPRSGGSRGGRHVELGYALARLEIENDDPPVVMIVGPRENLFCFHPETIWFANAEDFISHMAGWEDDIPY